MISRRVVRGLYFDLATKKFTLKIFNNNIYWHLKNKPHIRLINDEVEKYFNAEKDNA